MIGFVYYIYLGKELLYVGSTKNIISRSFSHLCLSHSHRGSYLDGIYLRLNRAIVSGVYPRFLIVFRGTLKQARDKEYQLIVKEKTVFNGPMHQRPKARLKARMIPKSVLNKVKTNVKEDLLSQPLFAKEENNIIQLTNSIEKKLRKR